MSEKELISIKRTEEGNTKLIIDQELSTEDLIDAFLYLRSGVFEEVKDKFLEFLVAEDKVFLRYLIASENLKSKDKLMINQNFVDKLKNKDKISQEVKEYAKKTLPQTHYLIYDILEESFGELLQEYRKGKLEDKSDLEQVEQQADNLINFPQNK